MQLDWNLIALSLDNKSGFRTQLWNYGIQTHIDDKLYLTPQKYEANYDYLRLVRKKLMEYEVVCQWPPFGTNFQTVTVFYPIKSIYSNEWPTGPNLDLLCLKCKYFLHVFLLSTCSRNTCSVSALFLLISAGFVAICEKCISLLWLSSYFVVCTFLYLPFVSTRVSIVLPFFWDASCLLVVWAIMNYLLYSCSHGGQTYTLLQNKRGRWLRAPPPTVHFRTDDVT